MRKIAGRVVEFEYEWDSPEQVIMLDVEATFSDYHPAQYSPPPGEPADGGELEDLVVYIAGTGVTISTQILAADPSITLTRLLSDITETACSKFMEGPDD